jgi:hypothetical protein
MSLEMEKGFVQKELYTAGKNNGIYWLIDRLID